MLSKGRVDHHVDHKGGHSLVRPRSRAAISSRRHMTDESVDPVYPDPQMEGSVTEPGLGSPGSRPVRCRMPTMATYVKVEIR